MLGGNDENVLNTEQLQEQINALEERLRRLGDTGLAAADGLQEVSAAGSLVAEAERKAAEAQAVKDRVKNELANTTIRTTQNVINALESTEKSFKKYNAAIDAATDGASGIVSQFGLMGKVLGVGIQALGALQKEVNIYRDAVVSLRDATFKSGAGMGATGEQMKALAKEAGFTYHNMDKLNSTMKGMSGSFSVFLGGADSAGESFMKMTKVTEKQRAEFSRLGIGFEELMEMQAGYAKTVAATGQMFNKMNVESGLQASISRQYVKDLMILSEITGKSAEEAQRSMEAQAALETEQLRSAGVMAEAAELEKKAKEAAARGDEEQAAKLRKQAAEMTAAEQVRSAEIAAATIGMSDEMKAGYITLMNTGGAAIDENSAKAMMMIERGGKDAAQLAEKLTKDTAESAKKIAAAGSEEERKAILDAETKTAQLRAAETSQALKEGAMAGIRELGPVVMQAMGVQGLKDAGFDTTQAKRGGIDEVEAMKEAQEARDRATEAGTSAIADAEASRQETEIKFRKGMESMVESLSTHKKALDALTIATGVLTAAFVAYKVASMFKGGAASAASTVAGTVMGGGGGGGLPGAASGGMGRLASLGTGLSGLGRGLGEGIAGFFKAFGGPQAGLVLAGAGVFAGVITLLGVGIAAAIAVVSLSLPLLAKSIQKFEELDGEKLWAVGKGVLGLGAGLAVFGAGGVAGGIGNMLGEAAGGITKFFGGKDIMGKLKEFANLDIKVDDFKAKSEALEIYAKAMATLGKAKGSVFSRKVDFSGPIKGMEQLSKAQISVENIEKYTPALEMFIKALNRFQPPKTGIVDGLLAAFGKEKKIVLPVDSFKEFVTSISGLDADPEKINAFTGALAVYIQGLAKLEGMKPSSGAMKIATGNIDAKGFVKFLSDLGSEGAKIDVEQFKGTMEMFKAFTSALSGMDSIAKAEDFDFENVAEEIVYGLDEFDVGLDDKTIKANIETAKTFLAMLKDLGGVSNLEALENFDYENVAEEMIYALRELSDDDDVDKTKIDANIPLIKQFMGSLKELEGIGLPSKELADYPYEDLVNNIMNGIVDVGDPDGFNPDPEKFNKNLPLMTNFLLEIKKLGGIALPDSKIADWPYETFVEGVMEGIDEVDDNGINENRFDKNLTYMDKFFKFWTSVKWQELTSSVKNLKDFKIPDNVYKEFERLDRLALKQKIMELIDKASDFTSGGTSGGGGGGMSGGGGTSAASRGPSTRRRKSSAASTSGGGGSSSDETNVGLLEGSHAQENEAPSATTLAGAPGAESPKEQVEKAGLKVRPYGDVYDGGLLKPTAVRVAQQVQSILGADFGYFTGLNDRYHQVKHPRSKHAIGQGIDLTMAKEPDKETAKEIKAKLAAIPGVARAYNEYYYKSPDYPEGDRNQYTTGGHFHLNTHAARGGVVDGPTTGFPAVLHGREQIVPLGNNSLLEKLGQTSADTLNAVTNTSTTNTNSNEDMVRAMINRLDEVIYKLDQANDIQDKILKYNMT